METFREMKRPRIYGNEGRCKAAVTRYARGADDLIDQAVGMQKRRAGLAGPLGEFEIIGMESEWEHDVRRWFSAARRGLKRYLQDQFEDVLPVLAVGLPLDTGKPRHTIAVENGVPWLMKARDELRELRSVLGVRRGVSSRAPASARFEELHASGLVAENVIDDYTREMHSPHTPKQLSQAIGAAKELTEATLRAALDRLGEPPPAKDDLQALMKTWRDAIRKAAPPDGEGAGTLDKAQASLASVVTFLAEWRNLYGRGHGRPEYSLGLSARHARLATDAAEASVRFIVTTLDDLELLPPEEPTRVDL
jgi:Abortive infection C-terminus